MFTLCPDVSLNVSDIDEASRYYQSVLGFDEVRRSHNWVEVRKGPFRFYLCADDGPAPMFLLETDDVAKGVDQVVRSGGKIIGENGGEAFVQDRYGVYFCIAPHNSSAGEPS